MAVSASALTVIDNMDSGKPYNAKTEKSDVKEGDGAISSSGSSGTIVIQRQFDSPVDISQYAGTGYVKLYLYIESVANMSDTSGQLELTSSGTCDAQETSWNISKNMLKDGWNTLLLSLESPGENSANLSAINFFRVYIHITGENKVMLDELSVGTEDELGVKAAVIETSEPVKTPEEAYGVGGAVAAAQNMSNTAAETVSNDTSGTQTSSDIQKATDTTVSVTDKSSENASNPRVSLIVIVTLGIAAAAVVGVLLGITYARKKSGK
jgi:hypothetical protein